MPARAKASQRTYAEFPYPYDAKALALGPAAYWPLGDLFGAAVESVAGNDGAYTAGCTLGQPGIGDGSRSVLLNPGGIGGGDSINIYSGGFAALFDGNEGAFGVWCKVFSDAALDGGYILNLYSNEPNRFYISRSSANAVRLFRKAAGVALFPTPTNQFDLGWVHWLMSWSDTGDEQVQYKNGRHVATANGLGTFAGALNASLTKIGNYTAEAGGSGWYAKGIYFDRPITPAEAVILGTVA
jgi:hypothetical protein